MTAKRSALAALAASIIAAAPLPALAQETAPAPAQDAIPPEAIAWVTGFMSSLGSKADLMLEGLGLNSPGVELKVTPEMVAAILPKGGTSDDVGSMNVEAHFELWNERTATQPPENPQDYVLVTEPQGCTSGTGEVIHFRTMAVDQALGHLCVVTTEDGAGVWKLRGRGLAIAGDLRVIVTYDMVLEVVGRPDRARTLGATTQEGAIQLSTALADYTLAATAVGQHEPTQDPVEYARRLADIMARMAAVVVADTPASATEQPRPGNED